MSIGTQMTAEEFMDLELEGRFELVRGELVEMSNPDVIHGFVCTAVASILRAWAKANQAGRVGSNDGAIQTESDPDTVRGADIFYFATERLPKSKTKRGLQVAPPNLIVEVLSPGNRWSEMLEKISEYLAAGVDEVWVVDPAKRGCQVFRGDSEPARFSESETITSVVLPGFAAKLSEFFEDI